MSLIIGLTGAAGAGKDTVAQMLTHVGWRSTAFANALYWEVSEHWHVDASLLMRRATKETPVPALAAGQCCVASWLHACSVEGHSLIEPRSARWLLQQWGTYRRAQRPDYWVRHVLAWIAAERGRHPTVPLIITDVRMGNEAAALRQLGAHIVRVHRPDATPLAEDTAGHVSEREAALITADADLVNDGSLAALADQTLRLVQALTARCSLATSTTPEAP